MIKTTSKNVKWRLDNRFIAICDCKKLIDLKLPLIYKSFMEKLSSGLDTENLTKQEKILLLDFEKMKLLSELKIKQITPETLPGAITLLDKEIGTERVRNRDFLKKKFKKFPQFFIGLFLDNRIVGFIGGFYREDYLLISEIAVDSRFQRRGFGKRLVKEFEKIAKKLKYKKINVGAQDNVVKFYQALGYKPFLLAQFNKDHYNMGDLNKFKILKQKKLKDSVILEIESKTSSLKKLKRLRKEYSKAYFQYIFTKDIK